MWNAPHCSAAMPFGDELRAAVDQPRLLGAVLQRLARDLVVVGLVGLAEVGGVGVRDRALLRASSAAPRWCRGRRKTRCRPSGRRGDSEECVPGLFHLDEFDRFLAGPSIMKARVSPSLYGCSRNLTPSPRSFGDPRVEVRDAERDVIGEMAARADQRLIGVDHVAAHRHVAEDERILRCAVHAVHLERGEGRSGVRGALQFASVRGSAAQRRGGPAAARRSGASDTTAASRTDRRGTCARG